MRAVSALVLCVLLAACGAAPEPERREWRGDALRAVRGVMERDGHGAALQRSHPDLCAAHARDPPALPPQRVVVHRQHLPQPHRVRPLSRPFSPIFSRFLKLLLHQKNRQL